MIQSDRGRWTIVAVFAFTILMATFAYTWQLGVSSIGNDDEGVHALVTREIRERSEWLTLHIRDDFYFRKPPLSFWVRAVTQNAFGESELTDRLPSALAGIGTTFLLAVWAWQWTRRRLAVLIVGLIFPFLPVTFTHTFRAGEADGLLIFLTTLAAWLLWRSTRRPWLVVAAGAVTGLAFMTKSVAAGVVPIGFGVALLLRRQWPYRWPQVAVAVAAFLAVAAPWHLQQYAAHGQKFWDEYVGLHIVQRVEERLHVTPKQHGPFWYAIGVENEMFPWSWMIVPAMLFAGREIRRRTNDTFLGTFLITWGAGTVVLFSLAATKLAWYVAPAYPAFVLLIVKFISEVRRWPRWIFGVTGAFALGLFIQAVSLYRTGVSRFLTAAWLPAPWAVGGVVAIVTAVMIVAARRSAADRTARMIVVLLGIHMLALSAVVYSRYIRRPYESSFRVFRNVIEARNPRANVFIYDIGYITSPLAYYYWVGPNNRRVVTPLRESPKRLAEVVASQPGSFVAMSDGYHPEAAVLQRLKLVASHSSLNFYQVLPKENR